MPNSTLKRLEGRARPGNRRYPRAQLQQRVRHGEDEQRRTEQVGEDDAFGQAGEILPIPQPRLHRENNENEQRSPGSRAVPDVRDRKSTRLNSSHVAISYAV